MELLRITRQIHCKAVEQRATLIHRQYGRDWGTSYSRPPIDPYLTSPLLQNPGGATAHNPLIIALELGRISTNRALDRYSFMPLTVILIIIISFLSPTLSFIPDLKPPFSANPSHCSLSFSFSGLTTRFLRLLLLLLSLSVFFTF